MAEAAVALASPTTWQDDCLALADEAWNLGLYAQCAKLKLELRISGWYAVIGCVLEIGRAAKIVWIVAEKRGLQDLRREAHALQLRAYDVCDRIVQEAT